MALAVALIDAIPLALVELVVELSVAEGPTVGADHVTTALGTGLPALSRITTLSGAGNVLPTCADCPFPLATAIALVTESSPLAVATCPSGFMTVITLAPEV